MHLQFVRSARTYYRTQRCHGTVVQRVYIAVSFIQVYGGVVAQSQVVHVIYEVVGEGQEVGGVNLPVYTGKYGIGTLLLIESSELRIVRHAVFVACDLQETVARLQAEVIALFVGSVLDIGDIEWARVCLMVPRNEEVGTVFHNSSSQRGTELVGGEVVAPLVATDVIRAGEPVGTSVYERTTGQGIRTRLGYSAYRTSSGTSVSHIVLVGHYLKLTDSFHGDGVRHSVTARCTTSRSRILCRHTIDGIVGRRSQLARKAGAGAERG